MNVADSLTAWASATPFAAAVVERGRVIPYRDLDRAVWRVAAWLRDSGIRPGDRVGVSIAGNSAAILAVVYGLARMGAVTLLLPPGEVPAIRLNIARRFHLAAVVGEDGAGLDGLPLLRSDTDWFAPRRWFCAATAIMSASTKWEGTRSSGPAVASSR